MNNNLDDFRSNSWEVHPILDVPEEFMPGVMFTILDSDPRPRYQKKLSDRSGTKTSSGDIVEHSISPEMAHEILSFGTWNTLFHDVPGDKVSLLFRKTFKSIAVMIRSNDPSGLKWLVTRSTWHGGKAVCWCVPFTVQKGQTTEVQLTIQNMITLDIN